MRCFIGMIRLQYLPVFRFRLITNCMSLFVAKNFAAVKSLYRTVVII
jgi:hypothetical protein